MDSGRETSSAELVATLKQMGVRQAELARALCTDRRTIRRWELGEVEPNGCARVALRVLCGSVKARLLTGIETARDREAKKVVWTIAPAGPPPFPVSMTRIMDELRRRGVGFESRMFLSSRYYRGEPGAIGRVERIAQEIAAAAGHFGEVLLPERNGQRAG